MTAFIVAEVGCNHKGQLDVAKEFIVAAAVFAEVDYVKFQKRSPRELLSQKQFSAAHPNPANSYGDTYGEHREKLEFTVAEHRQLLSWCQEYGVGYSTSVWDVTSAKELVKFKIDYLKIPSATNLDFELLDVLCGSFSGKIHISLGMTTQEEEDRIVNFLLKRGRAHDVVLYACTSSYPVPFDDVCLLEIVRLQKKFGNLINSVGFSGHHLGIAIDMGALTLGVQWIERHFTLDRTWKGTDHPASLEPDGLRRLVRDANALERALKYKVDEILGAESHARQWLKRLP